jgi:hypothetical protein
MEYIVRGHLHHEGKDYQSGDLIEFEKDDELAAALEAKGTIVSKEAAEKAEAEAEKAKAETEKPAAKRAKADAPAS